MPLHSNEKQIFCKPFGLDGNLLFFFTMILLYQEITRQLFFKMEYFSDYLEVLKIFTDITGHPE